MRIRSARMRMRMKSVRIRKWGGGECEDEECEDKELEGGVGSNKFVLCLRGGGGKA